MKAPILIILLTIACSLIFVFVKPGYSQTAENITAPVVPQGTSLEETGNDSTENQSEAKAGNITAPVVPQGTSLEETGNDSTENQSEAKAGNITAPVVPQGTSLEETGNDSTEK
jgi:hypothetical protein